MSSHVQSDGHDQVDEVARVRGFDQAWAQRADELENQLLGLDALESVAEELRVEADLERLAVEGNRYRLARLPHVRGLGRNRERSLAEAEPKRGILLREQADPANDVGQLRARQAQLVLHGLGQQLTVVRKLSVDQ